MKEPKTENVGSTDPVAPAAQAPVPESEEVKLARESAERRKRKDDLDEVAKLLATDVKNSAEQVAHYSIYENPALVREQLARLYERLQRAHGLLARHIENLPTCSIVNPAKDAPTA